MAVTRSFQDAVHENRLDAPSSHDELLGTLFALHLLGEDHNLVGESCWWEMVETTQAYRTPAELRNFIIALSAKDTARGMN